MHSHTPAVPRFGRRLPPLTPGAGPAPNISAPMPTHVHMVFGGEMTLGWYTPGPARTVGTFLRADPVTHRKSDHGQYVSSLSQSLALAHRCERGRCGPLSFSGTMSTRQRAIPRQIILRHATATRAGIMRQRTCGMAHPRTTHPRTTPRVFLNFYYPLTHPHSRMTHPRTTRPRTTHPREQVLCDKGHVGSCGEPTYLVGLGGAAP